MPEAEFALRISSRAGCHRAAVRHKEPSNKGRKYPAASATDQVGSGNLPGLLFFRSLCRLGLVGADCQNGTACMTDDMLGHAAEHQVRQAAPAVRGHDNQVRAVVHRRLDNLGPRRAAAHLGRDGHPGRFEGRSGLGELQSRILIQTIVKGRGLGRRSGPRDLRRKQSIQHVDQMNRCVQSRGDRERSQRLIATLR